MRREVEIVNELGLHARPAAEFVRAVQEFNCDIVIHRDAHQYSAASIIDVLTANLDCGTKVILEATGPDAEAALERLAQLLFEFREQESRPQH